MPACTDATVETRLDLLAVELEKCRQHRTQADPMNKRVWDEAIDYLLTLMMERDFDQAHRCS